MNHVSLDQIEEAHHTSAKYDEAISEFDQTHLEAEYKIDWYAPFVKGSPVALGCRYLNEYDIEEKRLCTDHSCHRTHFYRAQTITG